MNIDRHKNVAHWLADLAICAAHENGSALDTADIDAASLVADDVWRRDALESWAYTRNVSEPTDKQSEAIAADASELLIGWRGPRWWMKQ
jgi:hypothetical protein